MKKILFTCLVLLLFSISFANAQTLTYSAVINISADNEIGTATETSFSASPVLLTTDYAAPFKFQTDYAKKAKTQKTVAWVFVGAGAALIVSGMVVAGKNKDTEEDVVNDILGGAGLIVAGGLVGVASIPFFISSSRNKKKAGVTGMVMLQSYSVPNQSTLLRQPALGVRVKF